MHLTEPIIIKKKHTLVYQLLQHLVRARAVMQQNTTPHPLPHLYVAFIAEVVQSGMLHYAVTSHW